MRITEKQIRQQLETVVDPELNVNIVDLGLIYEIKVLKVRGVLKVQIVMTLTTPGCPMWGLFEKQIQKALTKLPGVGAEDIEVELTFDPPWTMERVNKKARAELGWEE